jgi:hypothetical protein
MSERKYCEDCKWFVDGHGFYMPFDRCCNPIAVEDGQVSLARRQHFVKCIDARMPDAACATPGKLFEPRPAPILKAKRSLWERIFGTRKRYADYDPNPLNPPWPVNPHNHDDIR